MTSRPRLTEKQDRILRCIIAGKSQAEIAEIMGVSKWRVRAVCRRLCEIYDVEVWWDLPDAVAARERPNGRDGDGFADDGRIRVDGSVPTV